MAAPTPLRPQLLNPSELQWTDATTLSIKANGKWPKINGLPNVLFKGTAKFITATDSGKQRIGMAVPSQDAAHLLAFVYSHLKPALANALAIPEPDATPLGRKAPAYKKQKTSAPTAPTDQSALQVKFSYSVDKYDETKAIVNMSANTVTKFYQVDMEAHTANEVDGLTKNADAEATCWISLSKSEKDGNVYYVNLMPKQVVYVESTAPPKEEDAAPVTFGGMSFN